MKKKVRKILVIASVLSFIVLISSGVAIQLFFSKLLHPQSEASRDLFAMDTYITMTAYGEDPDIALEKAASRITELEKLWSVTDAQSDIYAINHSDGEAVAVNNETADIISFTLQMSEKTGGALEPTIYPILSAWGFTMEETRVPTDTEIAALLEKVGYKRVLLEDNVVQLEAGMMLDLGAVGKGYAGDEAAEVLRANGITSALLDIGGNIQAIGSKPDGTNWKLGLRDPFSDGTLGILEISNLAVVTSGMYERYFISEDGKQYGHIIDPVTGYPAESGLASVTIIAADGRLCDALSTSLFVMGLDGASDYWKQHQNFDMILVTEDGEIYLINGIMDAFVLNSYHRNTKVNVIQEHL